VGDGDFSFSKGLALHVGTGKNLVLTSFDSLNELHTKYPQAKANVEFSKKCGATVMHGVDATNLDAHFSRELFDKIIFNFPHSGEEFQRG
jgi:25S rRNA (uracil2634-N3)-methyltransferase